MRGLIGRPRLESGEALVIARARRIHTFGLSYPIDVVFCDHDLKPRRVTRYVRRAHIAVELAGGSVPTDLRPGDRVEVRGDL
jgi:uncharacterized membrane protein (UPF0127 family)